MKKVFISHPYADDLKENFKKVDEICRKLVEKGEVVPISPLHLFSFTDDTYREDILQSCKRIISVCDEVWIYGRSKGCIQEHAMAKELGKKVEFKNKPVNIKINWE